MHCQEHGRWRVCSLRRCYGCTRGVPRCTTLLARAGGRRLEPCVEGELRDGDYFGAVLNRAARIMSAAHGGQVLLSAATAELVRGHLPEGVSLRELGEHRLKGLLNPERLLQVVAS